MLAEVIHLVKIQTLKNAEQAKSNIFVPTAPHTPKAIHSRIMEGKYAILPNLPHPAIRTTGDLAYVSIIDCIKDIGPWD